jgi:hypothetical protein
VIPCLNYHKKPLGAKSLSGRSPGDMFFGRLCLFLADHMTTTLMVHHTNFQRSNARHILGSVCIAFEFSIYSTTMAVFCSLMITMAPQERSINTFLQRG